jgi:chromodomain-helicase-DNA-binding protein 4
MPWLSLRVPAYPLHSDTDHDLDKLIERTEVEGDDENITSESGLKFNFAKIWAADKDALEDVGDSVPDIDLGDSWAQALERIAAKKIMAKETEVTGRGVRRKAAAAFPQVCPKICTVFCH